MRAQKILLALFLALSPPALAGASPVTLNFVDAPVADVLRAAARLGGLGLVLDGSTAGTVTIHATAEPRDFIAQLARMYGLTVEESGGTLFVSSAVNQPHLRRTYTFPVQYGAPERLAEMINLSLGEAGKTRTASKEDKNKGVAAPEAADTPTRVTAAVDSQSLVLYGTASEAESVRALLKEIDVPARQVSLEAKVLSLTNDASRELGVEWDWSSLPQTPEVTESWETLRHTETTADGRRATVYEDVPRTEVSRSYRGSSRVPGILQFGRSANGYPFEWYYEAKLRALVTEGRAKVLSRPNVTTLAGREAVIEIGGEVPVPTIEATDRATTTSFVYHKAGIILRYTPWVAEDGHITAEVHTEVSSPAYVADLKAYRFQKRSADTTVRLRDGETMVIGGLISSDEAKSMSKVPFLGDLPILGPFFRSERKSKSNSEIVIFLTAHVRDDSKHTGREIQNGNQDSDRR